MTVHTKLIESLASHRIEASALGGTVNAVHGQGPSAHRANLNVEPLEKAVHGLPEHDAMRLIQGFANGVSNVMSEPPRSRANTWEFNRAAGRLVVTLEVKSYEAGVLAAAGEDAFTLPFLESLVLGFHLELDRGIRALTTSQVRQWGVSDDRVLAAARSLLFHRTSELNWKSEEGSEVQAIRVGDSNEAARALVFADAFFLELNDEFRFSIPTQDSFQFVTHTSSLLQLQAATEKAVNASSMPLSASIFRFEAGRPTLAVTS